MKKVIYMDHAATTPTKPEVLEEMIPYFTEKFGNPSSVYSLARETKSALDKARERAAKALGASTDEIYFTGGGSEADNWALKGVAFANRDRGNHIITTKIEHHAILHACEYLEKYGFEITYLNVDSDGLIDLDQLRKSITDRTILVSIMFANNEIGTIQPIAEIGAIAKEKGVYFHTDAVQAIGNINVNVETMNIDLLSLSAHKFYGPKGIGVLYIRKGVKINSFLHGGAQEKGRRASTENVPAIVGLGTAIELASAGLESYNAKLLSLRDRTIEEIQKKIPYIKLNGDRDKRLPGNVNFSFEFIEGDDMDGDGVRITKQWAIVMDKYDEMHNSQIMRWNRMVARRNSAQAEDFRV
jgi:cysteine desulfurase